MKLPRAVVASQNPDKIAEIEAVLARHDLVGEIVRGLHWDEVIEDGLTLEDNALLKGRAVLSATGLPAIADDSGLEVHALGGAPGVYSARFSGPEATYATNVAALLEALEGIDDRRATFRTVIVLCEPDGTELMVEGRMDGVITDAPRGESGFGYDPVFAVDGVTYAEMGVDQKSAISHRARAIRALAEGLRARA